MTIEPQQLDLTIYQGATFEQVFTPKDNDGKPLSLEKCSIELQARQYPGAPVAYIDASSKKSGGIEIDEKNSTADFTMTADETTLLSTSNGVYDMKIIYDSGLVVRAYTGAVTLLPAITQ